MRGIEDLDRFRKEEKLDRMRNVSRLWDATRGEGKNERRKTRTLCDPGWGKRSWKRCVDVLRIEVYIEPGQEGRGIRRRKTAMTKQTDSCWEKKSWMWETCDMCEFKQGNRKNELNERLRKNLNWCWKGEELYQMRNVTTMMSYWHEAKNKTGTTDNEWLKWCSGEEESDRKSKKSRKTGLKNGTRKKREKDKQNNNR